MQVSGFVDRVHLIVETSLAMAGAVYGLRVLLSTSGVSARARMAILVPAEPPSTSARSAGGSQSSSQRREISGGSLQTRDA